VGRSFWISVTLWLIAGSLFAATEFKVGLFQAGDYTPHGYLRESFHRSLKLLTPPDTTIVFQASAFRSAQWNRESSKAMARELTAMRDLNMVVTIGPWVVEDLLEAGFTKPIIALFRTDPYLEGLIDSTLRPFAKNLTVQITPSRLNADITLLHRLRPFKKLGVLFFPSGQDSTALMRHVAAITQQLGSEAITAFGYNNSGTYAFLKAYAALPADVDAVYLLPMWGLDADKIHELAQRAASDRKTSATYEGLYPVDKGILLSSAGLPYEAEARFAAWKMIQIIRGKSPQSLPSELPFDADLTINAQTSARLGIDVTLEMTTQADLVKPLEETGQRFTLTEAMQRALDMNPGRLAWDEVVAQAQARNAEARAGYLPKVTVDGSAEYIDDNQLSNEQAIVRAPELIKNDRYRASLTLEQPIFSKKSIGSSRIASREVEVSRNEADSAMVYLETEITKAYLAGLQAQDLLAVERRQLQLVDHGTEVARGMLATGERDRSDMTRWQTEELRARREFAQREADQKVARIRLNALMNQSGNQFLQLDTAAYSAPAFWEAYELIRPFFVTENARRRTTEKLVNSALTRNPSMRIASKQIEAQKAKLASVWSSLYPTVSLRASFALTDEFDDTPFFAEKDNSWSMGALLRWPLFDGGVRGKASRTAKARLGELEYLKDQSSLDAMRQVSSLVEQLAATISQVLTADQETESATASIGAALDRYISGKEGYVVPIDAAQAAREAQLRLITARYQFFEQMMLLLHEAGWSPHLENLSAAQLLQRELSSTSNP
jgi:outer membrane protein TolC/ABC-type uncharacterized transport system substrate-binding protein